MSKHNFTLKQDPKQPYLPGLALLDDPTGNWLRVIALAVVYRWRYLESFAWQRLDELAGGEA